MKLPFFSNHVSTAEQTFLARQLATMLTSGLPIDRAIAILGNQTTNTYLATVLKQIESDLESGLSFSVAIAKHPRVFSRVYVNVVIAGEAVGKLAEVLDEMAGRLERDQEFKAKIQGALYYPIFVSLSMVVIGIVLMIKVVPQLQGIFDEAGSQLPLATRVLIAMSTFLSHNWLWVMLLTIGLVILMARYLTTEGGRRQLDTLIIHIPLDLSKNLYMARFSRTLSLLVQSGTPIIEALVITGEVINNHRYAEVISAAKEDISRGIPLSVPISKSNLFPLIVPQMIMVGEQTGRLDQVLASLADYYEQETDLKLKALASIFEPAMIIVIGLAVGWLVFSVFLPIYQIAQFQ